ncbi:MAG: FkbM family methyltransferase [Planctomycetota bacterium]
MALKISYAQNHEDILLDRFFGSHVGAYLDIGGNHPINDSNTYFFYERGWRGCVVEPQLEFGALYQQYRPRDLLLQAAIGTTAGTLPLYRVIDSGKIHGLTTLDAAIAETHRSNGFEVVVEECRIQPMADLPKVWPVCPDFVSIDVEGWEANVIRAFPYDRWQPSVFMIEATKPLSSVTTHESWEQILLEHDYLFAHFNGLNRFYLHRKHAEKLSCFSYPVCVLDGYFTNEVVSLKKQLKESRVRNIATELPGRTKASLGTIWNRITGGRRRNLPPLTSPTSPESPFTPAEPVADIERRIAITVGCHDCDDIAKHPNAGHVVDLAGQRVQIMHNGLKVVAGGYYGEWMTRIIERLRGHHEPQEERAFHQLMQYVSSGGEMLEVGAFWSYYSLWFHASIAKARNYMIEPDPNNLTVGKANFALNGFTGDFTQAAIGKTPSSINNFVCESDNVSRQMPVVSIDSFLAARRIDRLELLLCDAQGAELAMLQGASHSFASHSIRFVVVSTHHHAISGDPLTHQKCLWLIRACGGRILCEHSVHESYSGDGLIVAAMLAQDRELPEIAVSRNRASTGLFRELEFDLAERFA